MGSTIKHSDKSKDIIVPNNELKRKGWANALKEMQKNGDDELLIPDVFEDEDFTD
ncbi:MAG: hypothetical protein ACHQHN_00500 [Sphingobacteriales bacterium]